MLGNDTFNFKFNSFTYDRYAQLKISIDSDLNVIKAVVELDSLPKLHKDGYEVVVQFKLENFNHKNIFYTDSNGLEMQKHIFNSMLSGNVVPGNWFPITSAITLFEKKDQQYGVPSDYSKDKVLTVMNDRS